MTNESLDPTDPGLICPTCGYSPTAMNSNTCSECGTAFVITDHAGNAARPPTSRIRQVCYAAWVIGTILVIGTWINLVPNTIGWVGFGIGFVAWAVSGLMRR